MTVSDHHTSIVIFLLGFGAIFWAVLNFYIISLTDVESVASHPDGGVSEELLGKGYSNSAKTSLLIEIYEAIRLGAQAFLFAEYKICIAFCVIFFGVIVGLVSWGELPSQGILTGLAFALGAITSIISGYIGMTVAVYSNVRTTINAQKDGYSHCFNTAFRAGSVMGFALNGLGLVVLYMTLCFYRFPPLCLPLLISSLSLPLCCRYQYPQHNWDNLMECISGYGLGGSTIAMFGRVGGGIYTKAADVGADLVGKVVHGIPEDDPRNPATIADNVGDNVGDVAGMGADLFGSFAEATCACLVIGSQSADLVDAGWGAIMFPLLVSAFGLVVCFLTSFVATHLYPVTTEHRVELALRLQLILSTLLMIPATIITIQWLPDKFELDGVAKTFQATRWDGNLASSSRFILWPFYPHLSHSLLISLSLSTLSFHPCFCSLCMCDLRRDWRSDHRSCD
jgi:H+-translocating diphosphatase